MHTGLGVVLFQMVSACFCFELEASHVEQHRGLVPSTAASKSSL